MNTPLDLKSVEEAVAYLEKEISDISRSIGLYSKSEHIPEVKNIIKICQKHIDRDKVLLSLASLVLKASEVLPKEWSTEYTYPSKPNEYTKGEVNGANKMLDDCRLSFAKACIGLEEVVNNEPELPGDMPTGMFNAIKNDKDAIEKALRIAVKTTKKNIICAIRTSLGVGK